MRDRGSVVIIENSKVALIRRERDDRTYYVFPGGGMEAGETIEECAKREAFEELGVNVEINELLAAVPYNGTQYYFLAKIIGGKFGTGQGEEYSDVTNGTYLPIWLQIVELSKLDVIPKDVAEKVQMLYE